MGITVLDQRRRVVHCHSCQASRAIMLKQVACKQWGGTCTACKVDRWALRLQTSMHG
jgi:hypothetical protein